MKQRILLLVCASLVLCSIVFPQQKARQQRRLPQRGEAVKTILEKDGALTFHGIAEHRNLSAYDDGGSLDCRAVRVDEIKTPAVTKARVDACHRVARDFVWQHWQSKKRGYIRLTGNSVDATGTLHLFIEPDSHGNWQVIWKTVRDNNRLDELPPIRNVERKELPNGFDLEFISADGSTFHLPS